jgi:uncharacterized protein YifE (UPF0438 family)
MSNLEVWRYSEFRNGEYDTLPFEANYIELFRKTRREIFFDKKWEPLHRMTDRGTEHDNVLRLGHLIALDSLSENHNKEANMKDRFFLRLPDVDEDILTEQEKEEAWKRYKDRISSDKVAKEPKGKFSHGVHFWLREQKITESTYGGDIKIKATIPTDGNLWLTRGDGKAGDYHTVHNIEEMRQFYSKDDLINHTFQAVYTDNVPLKYINGIRDTSIHKSYSWTSLDNYLDQLRKYYIFEMEDVISEIKIHDDIEHHMAFLNEISNQLRKLDYYIRSIENLLTKIKERAVKRSSENHVQGGTIISSKKLYIQFLKNLEEGITNIINILTGKDVKGPGYIDLRQSMASNFDKEFSFEKKRYQTRIKDLSKFDISNNSEELKRLKSLPEYIKPISNQIEQLIENIREIAEKEKERMNNEDNFTKEEEFNIKVDKQLRDKILKVPQANALKNDLENKLEEIERRKSKPGKPPYNEDYLGDWIIQEIN